MPARKQPHEFTACEQFGTRYSALGKRIEASVPKCETAVTRTYTSELDIFQLCDLLGVKMSPEQVAEERAYIEKNRQLYEQRKKHKTMETKREFGLDANGYPVFPGETMYRKSNADKYTVQEDGSLKKDNGKTVTSPDWSNFVHTFDKTDKAEQLAAFRAKRHAPKQDNPLVEGEYKTRTPEEASKAAAKQREQERKKESAAPAPAAPTLDKATDKELLGEINNRPGLPCKLWDYILGSSSNERLCEEVNRRGILLISETIHDATDDQLRAECARRGLDTIPAGPKKTKPSERLLQAYTDKDLADELRDRGYEVKATKTVEL